MPAGVRLHHPHFASCTFVVELPKLYPEPYDCPSCKMTHLYKSIHLRLDANGDVLVNKGVYQTLLQVNLAGMQMMNEVREPPPLYVGAVEQPKYETQTAPLNGQNQRFYLPGSTKYESQDRMQKPFKPLLEKIAEVIDRKETAAKAEKRSIHVLNGRRKHG